MSASVVDPRIRFAEGIAPAYAKRARRLLARWKLADLSGPLRVETLAGGANNINLAIEGGLRPYVLKMRAASAAELNMALPESVAGQRRAAEAGLAPAVYAQSAEGDFLMERIEAVTLRPTIMREKACLPQVAQALRTLHELPPLQRTFDLFDDARVFTHGALKLGCRFDEEFERLWQTGEDLDRLIKQARPPSGFVHGDPNSHNMLWTETSIKFIDFDYCGTSMFAADLAIFIALAGLDRAEQREFLGAYDPGLDEGQVARVDTMILINALREISWAMFAQARVSESTTLFEGWSYENHIQVNRDAARAVQGLGLATLREQLVLVRQDARF